MYKVMIVDDEPWSRKVIKQLGEWDKLQLSIVGEAEDGSEGLRLIDELTPHIVITDMRMPGVDGVELLKALNERHPSLKIIVMSGYDDFIYLKQAIHSKAKEYLLKPVDPDELNAALAGCVRELQQTKQTSAIAGTLPLLLSNSKALEPYLEYRQLTYGYLLDLNAAGVSQTLNSLKQLLEIEGFEGSRLKEVNHDFRRMLEEFISTNELSGYKRLEGNASKSSKETQWDTVNETIGQIGRMYSQVIEELQEMRRRRNKLDMGEVVIYINRNYKEAITLESIADYFYISKEHLSRVFKSFSGETVTDYINRKRMEKAKQLIVEHKLSIKHAAEMIGYSDLAYFYRVFKKHYGFAPGELRKGME